MRDVALAVLAKLPGEHDIRAIDLDRELRPGLSERAPVTPRDRRRHAVVIAGARQKPSANLASSLMSSGVHGGVKVIVDCTSSTPSSSDHELLDLLGDLGADRAARAGERVGDLTVPPSTATS